MLNAKQNYCSIYFSGIFENLFKHCEITFIDLYKLDGLDVLFDEWQRQDFVTLKQSLNALFNLWRPYECLKKQNFIIKHNIHVRFFTLIFKTEDNIKYYIAIWVKGNKVSTAIIKSKISKVIAKSNLVNVRGQSQMCLEKHTFVLNSDREETLADQSCQLIVEEVPYRPNMCVYQWSTEDVRKWFKKNGFSEFTNNLLENRIDGDLLLRLTEDELKNEIGIHNGIMKNRFV